jgi:hypothetical protein
MAPVIPFLGPPESVEFLANIPKSEGLGKQPPNAITLHQESNPVGRNQPNFSDPHDAEANVIRAPVKLPPLNRSRPRCVGPCGTGRPLTHYLGTAAFPCGCPKSDPTL